MRSQMSSALVFTILICSLYGVDWQGYGNMSSSNLTAIWSFIDSNVKAAADGGTLTTFSSDLSTHLNSLWDTAWNVVTVQTIAQKDTVLYGYAFRDHWMWYNGYRISGKIFGFVIWKDYNCKNWGNVGKGAPQGIPITKQIYDCMDQTIDISDIWKVGKAFINNLKGQADFQGDKAYSIVLSQDYDNTEMYGRVCMVDNKHFYSSIVTKTIPGRMMFFQTR